MFLRVPYRGPEDTLQRGQWKAFAGLDIGPRRTAGCPLVVQLARGFDLQNHLASAAERREWTRQYKQLQRQLSTIGWISEGYVQDRGPGAGGPCYQWTRKVRGKTVSLALSREQFDWLQTAIENWKQLKQTLKEMQLLSRRVLFRTTPHPKRLKPLSDKVLGLK